MEFFYDTVNPYTDCLLALFFHRIKDQVLSVTIS